MPSRIRAHVRSNVVAYLAVFLALGGTAYALGRGDVKTRHLADNAVKTAKIANSAVSAAKLGCAGNSSQDKMVKVGSTCIDRYENSIWTARTGGTRITGAIPCDANGQDCKGVIFARSVAGVPPRDQITYFQAQQALANSGKRLPTNAEWQAAVAGTPDPGSTPGAEDCNTSSAVIEATGNRANCISDWGASDMVGNIWEWVADWDEQAAGVCGNWDTELGEDLSCIGRAAPDGSTHFPGGLGRGGDATNGSDAGAFAIGATGTPSSPSAFVGFRGAR